MGPVQPLIGLSTEQTLTEMKSEAWVLPAVQLLWTAAVPLGVEG